MAETDRIAIAAEMAGQWWALRLSDDFMPLQRQEFAAKVAELVDGALRGRVVWKRVETKPGVWTSQRFEGGGKQLQGLSTRFDYDPDALLAEALWAVVPDLTWSKAGRALPRKHDLLIRLDAMVLEPKEGYGHWTAHIPIPHPSGAQG